MVNKFEFAPPFFLAIGILLSKKLYQFTFPVKCTWSACFSCAGKHCLVLFFLIKLWYFYQCASSFVRVSLSLIVPGHNDFLWPLYLHLIHILCFSPQWITSYSPVPQNLGKPFLTPPSSEILIPFGPNYFQFTLEMFLKSNLQRRYGFSEALVSVAQSLYHKGGSL